MTSYKIPANIIRQWCFCPRVVYYRELLNLQSYKPLWVKQGEDKHLSFKDLIRRREFAKLGLSKGIRYFDLSIESEKYDLYGVVDLIIECENAVYVVDYKTGDKIYRGQIMQMIAYCLLAQERFNKPAPYGIFLYGDRGRLNKMIEIKEKDIQELLSTCNQINDMLSKGVKPNSDASIHQCMQCEYLNHCNDRGE